jgi:putative sulfotransferase
MLSRLVHEHPKVLGLSEFFAGLDPLGFTGGEPDGAAFLELLSAPRLKPNTLLRKGVRVPEYGYPVGSGRYAAGDVPAISLMTLPPLTDDPDGLLDRIRDEVARWPAAPLSQQYVRLFDWLAALLGREVVVERSGASLRYLPDLLTYFPAARFVFMYRDGPDCAMSMSRHPLPRLALLIQEIRGELGVDPFQVRDPAHAPRLPERLRPFTPDTLDATALARADIPLDRFGALWSYATVRALRYLAGLPAGRLLHMSYDRLVADPVTELARFGRFAAVPDAAEWARRVAGGVDAGRVGAANALTPEQAGELRQACAPGTRRIAEFLRQPLPAGT